MKLYIANTTLQTRHIHFRVPEVHRSMPFDQIIPPGQQAVVWKDDTREVLQHIVDHLCRFDLVHVSEIDRTKTFIGLCYDFDKPVSQEIFMRVQDHNHDVKEKESDERMTAEIHASADALARTAQSTGQKLLSVETDVIQEKGGEKGAPIVEKSVRAEVQSASGSIRSRNGKRGR